MKIIYYLGLDVAKLKVRAALGAAAPGRCLWEKDLPVCAAGLRELLEELRVAQLKEKIAHLEERKKELQALAHR